MKRRPFLLIIFLCLLVSCSVKEDVSIDSITIKEVRAITTLDGLDISQQGLFVTISSLDFDVNQNYEITISSPLEKYSWHAKDSPVEKDTIPSILLKDLFMPPHIQFPSGIYTLEILQEDTSFIKSHFEYTQSSNFIKLEPINITFEERDGTFYVQLLPELQGDVVIDFYDASHTMLLTLRDVFTHEKLNDESFRNSVDRIIVQVDDKDIYRIVL